MVTPRRNYQTAWENMWARLKASNIFSHIKIKPSNKPIPAIPDAVWTNPWYFFVFGFGIGIVPFAPGTFGTLLAIPLYLVLNKLPLWFYLTFVALFIAFGSYACEKISNTIGEQDHPGMCIDEFAGFFVTMIGAPSGWGWIVLGFLLFRLFDIWKPWPIRYLDEHVHGGFGMILDDVVAGIFAMLVLQFIHLIC